jgi:hypothetical protein
MNTLRIICYYCRNGPELAAGGQWEEIIENNSSRPRELAILHIDKLLNINEQPLLAGFRAGSGLRFTRTGQSRFRSTSLIRRRVSSLIRNPAPHCRNDIAEMPWSGIRDPGLVANEMCPQNEPDLRNRIVSSVPADR